MKNEVYYAYFYCDEWKSSDSMSFEGVYTKEGLLQKLKEDQKNDIVEIDHINEDDISSSDIFLGYIEEVTIQEAKNYYAVYDKKLDGYKPRLVSENQAHLIDKMARLICDVTAYDTYPLIYSEPIDEILEVTGHEVIEVDEDLYYKLLNSDEPFFFNVIKEQD